MTELTAHPPGEGQQAKINLEQIVPPALPQPDPSVDRRRWSAWPAHSLERLPWPFAVTVIALALLALGEQMIEFSLERASLGGTPAISPLRLAVFPLLLVYILSHIHILKRAAVNALSELRPIVMISDEQYEGHVRRMVVASRKVEFFLLLVSTLVVLVLFVGLGSDLLNTNSGLPASLPVAVYIVGMYTLLGWILLSLVYNSTRQARALAALARCPITVNVFDPSKLLPFGRLGLIQSLPIVGIVLVPLILFGAPTQGGYVVIFLSGVSFLALFVPLWGVHQQIDRAQEGTLSAIHDQLQEIHDVLMLGLAAEVPNLGALADRTAMLVHLRKTVMEAPSWPFKDSATVVRVILAVTSPMVYFVLNELIRLFLLPVLAGNNSP